MAVDLLTEFPARPRNLIQEKKAGALSAEPLSHINLGRRATRPVAITPGSVGCFRGIFYAVSFEAAVALAGLAIWEAWRLIR